MLSALALSVIIASSTASSVTNVSASASGGSSAEASTRTVMSGGSSTVEVYTNIDGVERTERRESTGGNVELHVEAKGSATTSAQATTTIEKQKITARVIALVRSILAFFGLSVRDL